MRQGGIRMLLTAGVWLLLIVFVIVHSETILKKLKAIDALLILRRILTWMMLVAYLGGAAWFTVYLYMAGSKYEGFYKLPFWVGMAFSSCFFLMIILRFPVEFKKAYHHPISFEFNFKSKLAWFDQGADLAAFLIALAIVGASGAIIVKAFHWSYEHRLHFLGDGGVLVVGKSLGLLILVWLVGSPLLKVSLEIRDAISEERPLIWKDIFRRARTFFSDSD